MTCLTGILHYFCQAVTFRNFKAQMHRGHDFELSRLRNVIGQVIILLELCLCGFFWWYVQNFYLSGTVTEISCVYMSSIKPVVHLRIKIDMNYYGWEKVGFYDFLTFKGYHPSRDIV